MTRLLALACMSLAMASAAAAMPISKAGPPAAVHPAHGCHQTWRKSEKGWHRHGPKCDLREGLADKHKRPGTRKKASATSA